MRLEVPPHRREGLERLVQVCVQSDSSQGALPSLSSLSSDHEALGALQMERPKASLTAVRAVQASDAEHFPPRGRNIWNLPVTGVHIVGVGPWSLGLLLKDGL